MFSITHNFRKAIASGVAIALRRAETKSIRVAVAVAMVVGLSISVGTLSGLGIEEAKAAGYNKTLTGRGMSHAGVCAVDESRAVVRCALTNAISGSVGQYSLVVPSGHYYYLFVYKTFGCGHYAGTGVGSSTSWFWIGDNAANPTFINGTLYPNSWSYWKPAC